VEAAPNLTIEQAYQSMVCFLEAYWERTQSDEIGALLGGLALDADGRPMDPAAWSDWLAAIELATT